MIVASGVRGGRSYGAYDDRFTGIGIDLASGELDTNAAALSTGQLGATLLALAGVDAPSVLTDKPITGLWHESNRCTASRLRCCLRR